ncbi:hypothetical protein BKA67DRAFT_661139 [Truncatella angustata]|uniref:Uncharacterized protein n=1 Tax=Truncatella angustata TaxID=152316 RepID=A0A9P8ZWW6_9PEZI|nr:uncharacterized protein BKA67DRAFT_661139 [Truncatella angustata]KAH6652398.1 hypothetical protein BKA67DRAFT_661139 [Truncatella angustata]
MAPNSDASMQGHAKRAYSFSQRQVDRVISPQRRQKSYDATTQFATEKPAFFAFIVSQLFFSALPIGLFISFSLSTVALAVISAVAFSFFWVGIALLVLVPILFITVSIAIVVWLWAFATFLVGRWVYRMLPVSLQGDVQVRVPNGKQVIFQKDRNSGAGIGFDQVKEEATEVEE